METSSTESPATPNRNGSCKRNSIDFLPAPARGAEAWLAFMMDGVPALRALGWEIAVEPEFPYRVVAADDWYADLQTARPAQANHPRGARRPRGMVRFAAWRHGDGHAVNLLPALVDYLQGATGSGTARQTMR